MNARPSKDAPPAPPAARHNPDVRSPRRDTLIDDVSRELKQRHGGNDVLNRLEAEILVDHFLDRRHEEREHDESHRAVRVADVIRHARWESRV